MWPRMSATDWFRNETWNDATEARFFDKLRRVKDKQQPLRIQASYLSKRHPKTALDLLERYFAFGNHFDLAQAFVDQAEAYLTLGDLDNAVASLKKALQREREFPNVLTQAWSRYALLVAEKRLAHHYDDALNVLRERPLSSSSFPVDGFRWNAACALIADAQRLRKNAVEFAARALRFAEMTTSGFPRHPNVGLVGSENDHIKRDLQRLVCPSLL